MASFCDSYQGDRLVMGTAHFWYHRTAYTNLRVDGSTPNRKKRYKAHRVEVSFLDSRWHKSFWQLERSHLLSNQSIFQYHVFESIQDEAPAVIDDDDDDDVWSSTGQSVSGPPYRWNVFLE